MKEITDHKRITKGRRICPIQEISSTSTYKKREKKGGEEKT